MRMLQLEYLRLLKPMLRMMMGKRVVRRNKLFIIKFLFTRIIPQKMSLEVFFYARITCKKKSDFKEMAKLAWFISFIEPRNIDEAVDDEFWKDAMHKNMEKFTRLQVWDLVPRPVMAFSFLWITWCIGTTRTTTAYLCLQRIHRLREPLHSTYMRQILWIMVWFLNLY